MPSNTITPNPPRWQPNPEPSSIHVPGLDPNASVLDQIEQIEQLITIKLQNIDETFSKIHNVLANKLLPAVKRYAVGTEPVREAAKFWTSFYEQAAQIRIPTYDDCSSVNEQQSRSEQEETETATQSTSDTTQHFEPSSTENSENSFQPGQAAYSSTPARHHALSTETFIDHDESVPTQRERLKLDKGKQPEPLLRGILRQAYSASSISTPASISPLKLRSKPKTPIPKNLNPYLPPNTKPADWSGIVDLADPNLTTPRHKKHGKSTSRHLISHDTTLEDSFDGLPAGMSPPVLMSPARPPRSSAELILGKTPTREAVERITRDLISDVQLRGEGGLLRRHLYINAQNSRVESSMSTLPTPPSLSQYRPDGPYGTDSSGSLALDPSIERMMRQVELNTPQFGSNFSEVNEAFTPHNPAFHEHEYPDLDSDSDSLDDINTTAHPSAAFLMASQAPRGSDDSFGSSNRSSDSLSDEEVAEGLEPVHPFARGIVGDEGDDGFDDSFDDDAFVDDGMQEETLFGVPPTGMQAGSRGGENLRMLGVDRLKDTIGVGAQMAQTGRVEESPTPAPSAWPDRL